MKARGKTPKRKTYSITRGSGRFAIIGGSKSRVRERVTKANKIPGVTLAKPRMSTIKKSF